MRHHDTQSGISCLCSRNYSKFTRLHGAPWVPSSENGRLIRFINEIVMEEESDLSFGSESENYSSHFEIYLESMKEVQCPVDEVLSFMSKMRDGGLDEIELRQSPLLPARS